jgi:hypothetical protein
MGTIQSGNKAHDSVVAVAEGARQTAVAAAGSNQAAVAASEIVFYRAVLASCLANNNSAGAGCAITALKSLGTGGA